MTTPREDAHRIAIACGHGCVGGHGSTCDRITNAIAAARADGYFERYDNPHASPHDAEKALGCEPEIARGIYERTT